MKRFHTQLKAIKFRNLITYLVSPVICLIFNHLVYYFHDKYIAPYKTDIYLFVAIKIPLFFKKTASNWLDFNNIHRPY